MIVLSVDPGAQKSGLVYFNSATGEVINACVLPNHEIINLLSTTEDFEVDILAIEKIIAYGRIVGNEVFETCISTGRFQQCWHSPEEVRLVTRKKVLSFLGATNDATVRAKLIKLLGLQPLPGTKDTYQVSTHSWSALAVALTACKYEPYIKGK